METREKRANQDQVGHLATRLSPARTNSDTLRTPFSLKAETVRGPVIRSTVPLKASCSLCVSTILSLYLPFPPRSLLAASRRQRKRRGDTKSNSNEIRDRSNQVSKDRYRWIPCIVCGCLGREREREGQGCTITFDVEEKLYHQIIRL